MFKGFSYITDDLYIQLNRVLLTGDILIVQSTIRNYCKKKKECDYMKHVRCVCSFLLSIAIICFFCNTSSVRASEKELLQL